MEKLVSFNGNHRCCDLRQHVVSRYISLRPDGKRFMRVILEIVYRFN